MQNHKSKGIGARFFITLAGAAMACACSADVQENGAANQSAVSTGPDESGAPLTIMPSNSSNPVSLSPSGSSEVRPVEVTPVEVTPVVTPTDAPPAAPSPGGVSVRLLSTNGSGCPGGPATLVPGPSPEVFTLKFPSYSAAIGGDAAVSERRRNCLMLLDVTVPAGYTFAVASASLSGSANLAGGVTGRAMVSYYFTGESATPLSTYSVPNGKWSTPGVFEPQSLAYAPCDAQSFLSVNTSIALTGENGASKSTTSLDPSTTLQLQLRKCQ